MSSERIKAIAYANQPSNDRLERQNKQPAHGGVGSETPLTNNREFRHSSGDRFKS